MKKAIIILTILLTTTVAKAEGLNSNSSYIKSNYSKEYEQTLKKYALAEWKDDYSMVIYEINKQSDALVNLIDEFESDNTNVAFRAMQEWSRGGYRNQNIKLFKEMKTFGLNDLLKMHCDWSMVKYEYDKQAKAKNSF